MDGVAKVAEMSEWIKVKEKMPKHLEEVLLLHIFKKNFHPFENDYVQFVGYWDRLNNRFICSWVSMLGESYESAMLECELTKSKVQSLRPHSQHLLDKVLPHC